MLIQIQKNQKVINFFSNVQGQKWVWPVWSWYPKIDFISKNEQMIQES